jgi:dihydrofolate reductase
MNFSVISAADARGGIGKNGLIPWRFHEDFKWFKSMTMGTTCFMGRITYEELAKLAGEKKELLPGRKCVVISQNVIDDPRVVTCTNIDNYRDFATKENFFIGGTSIFKFGLSVSDYVYLTAIPGDYGCNVFFPHRELAGNFVLNREVELTPELKVEVYERVRNTTVDES